MNQPKLLALLAVALGALPIASSQADLDLTPRYATSDHPAQDDFQRLYFSNGDEEPVIIKPDHHTTVTGGSGETTLQFNNLQGASLLLRNSPLRPDLSFSEANLETYRATARQFAPQGQLKVVKESEEIDISLKNIWDASVFTTTYALPGSEVTQSVTFINYTPKQQIVLVLSAFSNEFEDAQSRMDQILRTWSSMSPERLRLPDDN
ncbi:MAG TPA: hypothetical protein VNQ90_10935 [Chthoniobacteraceae bacterium]|nr:hypothetical protein [Chthoniobacteraceae bacterium]